MANGKTDAEENRDRLATTGAGMVNRRSSHQDTTREDEQVDLRGDGVVGWTMDVGQRVRPGGAGNVL